jgi:surface protein
MALAHRAKVKDPAKAFISTWRTSIVYTGSTANNQIKLPLEVAGTYKFTVQWGDGTSNLITTWNQAETTHTYPAPGDYTVTITGFIKGWDWGGGGPTLPTTGDMRKLLTITQFGCLRFVTHAAWSGVTWGSFYGCTNLTLTGLQDMPNFKGCTALTGFLRGCSAITTVNSINKWDVSKITFFALVFSDLPLFDDNIGNWNMRSATSFFRFFYGSPLINYGKFNNGGSPSIGNWDTPNLIDMQSMFTGQTYFNQNIGNWNIGNVTVMSGLFSCQFLPGTFNNGGSDSIKNWDTRKVFNFLNLFRNQKDFNQEVGLWNTSNLRGSAQMFLSDSGLSSFNNAGTDSIKNWNTSQVTDVSFMFNNATVFNQPIGNWDTSKVTNMNSVFRGSTTFNQLVSNWNVSLVTNFSNFMTGKTDLNYSTANYDALLIGWASRPVIANRSINFGTIKRTAASTAARAILTSAPNNWTIVDGGLI